MNGILLRSHGTGAMRMLTVALVAGALLGITSRTLHATPGEVLSHQKISDTEGSFTGVLDDSDFFGSDVASLGDLDGAGPSVHAIAVGASEDDDGGTDRGAVWILFLDASGSVMSHQKISDTAGNFSGILSNDDSFGASVASLGDLDGAGSSVHAIAVGAPGDDDGGNFRGAVWILLLDDDGTVLSHQKISDTQGGFTGVLDDFDTFGISVAGLGDLDAGGSSVQALAVGAYLDDDGGGGNFAERGAVWVLFLNASGLVLSHQKISDTQGGFTGVLDDGDFFGAAVARLDLGTGSEFVLAVGASKDGDGATQAGAVWLLFLNAGGTVSSHQKISATQGGFTGTLDSFDDFGNGLANMGDLDGNGIDDLAVGASGDDDGGGGVFDDHGAVWILFLDSSGMVLSHQKISDTEGSFTGTLDDLDGFGLGLAALGDLDGDTFVDVVVGAPRDDDGGSSTSHRGAVWVLFLDGMSVVGVPAGGTGPTAGSLARFPNPFTADITFQYSAPRAATVRGRIYDSHGRIVVTLLNREVAPGRHSVTWDGRDHRGRHVSAGTYFARFEIGRDVHTTRAVRVE